MKPAWPWAWQTLLGQGEQAGHLVKQRRLADRANEWWNISEGGMC